MSRIPKGVAAAVLERANGQCEICGVPFTDKPVLHHRQARGMGGGNRPLDTVANIIAVDALCHGYAHNHPDWARERGYIVSQYAETPVA